MRAQSQQTTPDITKDDQNQNMIFQSTNHGRHNVDPSIFI